jgi:hypothetical protein
LVERVSALRRAGNSRYHDGRRMDFASGSRFRFAPATPHKTAKKTEETLEGCYPFIDLKRRSVRKGDCNLRRMIPNGS